MPVLTPGAAVCVLPSSPALARLRAKQRAVGRVIAGTLSLLDAAVCFGDGEKNPTGHDGEALCRTVIGWVHLALSDRPEQAEAASERLEDELRTVLARHGCVRLPRAG
jgi:hypothetical protein